MWKENRGRGIIQTGSRCGCSLPVHVAKPVNPEEDSEEREADSFQRCREADDNERAPLNVADMVRSQGEE